MPDQGETEIALASAPRAHDRVKDFRSKTVVSHPVPRRDLSRHRRHHGEPSKASRAEGERVRDRDRSNPRRKLRASSPPSGQLAHDLNRICRTLTRARILSAAVMTTPAARCRSRALLAGGLGVMEAHSAMPMPPSVIPPDSRRSSRHGRWSGTLLSPQTGREAVAPARLRCHARFNPTVIPACGRDRLLPRPGRAHAGRDGTVA